MASLVPRPLPDLSCSRGEPIFLEGGEIKSGSGLGTRLATHYAPYEEVTKTLRHCPEEVRHGDVTAGVKRAWNVITVDKYSLFHS